jgi:hypothetical protein
MPAQPKPKKVGRPKLPKGEARGKIVALRFSVAEMKRVSAAARASNQNFSEWVRSTLNAVLEI